MNANRYQEQVLEGPMRQFYKEMKAERVLVDFQQDGARSHTARSTLRWFKENGIHIH